MDDKTLEKRQMRQLLEKMIEALDEKNPGRLLKLNDVYEKIASKVYHHPPTEIDPQYKPYEDCRQSCVMALELPDMHEKLISNAKETLSIILKME